MFRTLSAVILAAIACIAMAQSKVNIGYSPAADFTPVFAAKDKGFFEKRGLDVTLTRIPLASNIPAAIVADSLQIGMGTGSMLVQTAEAGLGLVALNGASRFQKSNSIVSLVARSGEKIQKPEDFKGKKVGVPGLNSMLHVLFQKWLLDNKVPLNQVTMIEAPFPQMNDMLKGGTIDAAVAIEPFRTRIVSGNTGYRVADYVTDVQDNVLAAFWMAKADWAKANPQAVRAFREAYDEALAWCVKNPEEAKQLQVKYLGFPSPVVPSYSSSISPEDLEIFEQAGRQVGMLRGPVDVRNLVWK
ncbi:MAG: ABC transporter substrate-binding protein [Betaproteobacteria bacterium]|nr:ABC transporter substrate-binding protein [Betaproteobacteria bacterium]